MFTSDVSLPIAFGAGFLSFFSPCILPMIPGYIMYITGSITEEDVAKKKIFALNRTFAFVIGFTIIFMIMGSSATILGRIFIRNKTIFTKISGLLIIVFGLNMMGIIKLGFLNFNKRLSAPKKITSWLSSTLMGMAFAAGWTPCFGPVLASILILAGGADTISKGMLLLLIYSIGMGVPFILTALFINSFDRFMKRSDKFVKYIPVFSGFIMVVFGLLVFFNKVVDISRLLI